MHPKFYICELGNFFQHSHCLNLSIATIQYTDTYLVPSANPIWSWRLCGGLDALGAPTILGDVPYTHYCRHHAVDGGQV